MSYFSPIAALPAAMGGLQTPHAIWLVSMSVSTRPVVRASPSPSWQYEQLACRYARARASTLPVDGSFHTGSTGALLGAGAPESRPTRVQCASSFSGPVAYEKVRLIWSARGLSG